MPSKTQGNRNKVTMSDIARCTGYSVNTVSHALNGIDDVRESTKKLILSTAKKLGYIPNSAAISMRNGRTMAVAAIIPDITGLYFPIMVKLLDHNGEIQPGISPLWSSCLKTVSVRSDMI